MALTDTGVRKAKPAAAQYKIADGRGLYLAVTPQGGKLWRWKYRFEGKEQSMSFGRYPDVSLAQARELHAGCRRLLASGVNPMVRRKVERTADKVQIENSFETIANRWIEHWKEDKSLRHVDSTRRRLDSNIVPYLGRLPVTVIVAPDIVEMVRAVEERGARDVAKRALETTGQIFRYAIAHGYAERNPASEVKPRDILKATLKTNYARVDAKELPELLQQIEVYRGSHVTILHEQGFGHEHIELQLAHAPRNAVSVAYNHALYLEPRSKMMQHWADFLEQTQRGSKVLPFRAGAA